MGPSPRVRGKPCEPRLGQRGCQRSIPARAGETRNSAHHYRGAPRSIPARAGETFGTRLAPRQADLNGPSPRVRGKPQEHRSFTSDGSIPARAGETSDPKVSAASILASVHPRACGGNFAVRTNAMPPVYPRAARARPMSLGVHPRACGGNNRIARSRQVSPRHSGPSPRVRGKHPSR